MDQMNYTAQTIIAIGHEKYDITLLTSSLSALAISITNFFKFVNLSVDLWVRKALRT